MHQFKTNLLIRICLRTIFLLILCASVHTIGFPQVVQPIWQRTFESLAESLTEHHDQVVDLTALYEQLMELSEDPIAINTASMEDLDRLIILSDYQKGSLYRYIQTHGPILSMYEIPYIFGFDIASAELLEPFIRLDVIPGRNASPLRSPLKYGRHQLFFRMQSVLEPQLGYQGRTDSLMNQPNHSKYLGSPLKIYTRYGYSDQDRLRFGWTMEKDQGEPFFGKVRPYGFDFYSAFLQVGRIWKIKNLIIGDYAPRFGQGLTLWSGPGYGRSSEVLMVEKRRNEIRKYSSTNENQYFRGLATTLDFGLPEVSVFLSSKKIDARVLETDSLSGKPLLAGPPQELGVHATPSQLANRRTLHEWLYGLNISFRKNQLHLGSTALGYSYDIPVVPGDRPYELYDFSGRTGYKLGFDYKYVFHAGTLYGEASHSLNGGWALIQGGTFMLREGLEVSLVYRNYGRKFQPIYSQAFGASSSPVNEKGCYAGIQLEPVRFWRLSAYADIFSFPWLKYRVDAPSNGQAYFFEARFTPADHLSMHWQARHTSRQVTRDDDTGLPGLIDMNTLRLRYHVNYAPVRPLELRNRVEWTRHTC